MLNIMRMDLRRLFKSRYFYICLACLIGYLLIAVMLQRNLQYSGEMAGKRGYNPNDIGLFFSVNAFLSTVQDFAYVHIPIVVPLFGGIIVSLFVTSEVQSGYIKNVYLLPQHRWYLILSKILIFVVISILGLIISFIIIYLAGKSMIYHFSYAKNPDEMLSFVLWMLLLFVSFFSLIALISELTRSKTIALIFLLLVVMNVYLVVLSSIANRNIGIAGGEGNIIQYLAFIVSPIASMRTLFRIDDIVPFVDMKWIIPLKFISAVGSVFLYNGIRTYLLYKRDI